VLTLTRSVFGGSCCSCPSPPTIGIDNLAVARHVVAAIANIARPLFLVVLSLDPSQSGRSGQLGGHDGDGRDDDRLMTGPQRASCRNGRNSTEDATTMTARQSVIESGIPLSN
jgi:hypothetical protein